jgi:hypothetical protein
MLLMLPFALFGLAALFHLLLLASSRALSFAVAACAAFAAQAAGFSFWAAALAVAVAFFTVDAAIAYGGIRLRGSVAGVGLAGLVFIPAALAGYSVGALAAAWVGLGPAGPGLGAAIAACLIVWRRLNRKGTIPPGKSGRGLLLFSER